MTGRFQTGDRHPVHKLLAFVEYCACLSEVWTSIAGVPEERIRLVCAMRRYPPDHKCMCRDTSCNALSGMGPNTDDRPAPR